MHSEHTREQEPRRQPKRQRRSWRVRLLAVTLAIIMCLLSVPLFVAGTLLGRLSRPEGGVIEIVEPPEGAVDPNVSAPPTADVQIRDDDDDIINILLVGLDTRNSKSFSGLSDSMMVLTLDRKRGQIRLTSFLRDTFVNIPRSPHPFSHKLNAAYSTGGISLLQKTLRERYSLDVSEYIVVNFAGLSAIVNKLGGISMELTAKESQQIPTLTSFSGGARTVNLDGKQALAYARIRYIDDDFRRTGRQQNVINAIFNKVKTMNVTKLTGLLYEFLPYVQTNISDTQLLRYATDTVSTYRSYALKTGYHVPQDGNFRYESVPMAGSIPMSVISITNWDKAVRALHDYVFEGKE